MPRVISATEWEPLAAGLGQRVRALDRWCADVYGERRIVRDGVVPARVIETTDTLEPELRGVEKPLWVGVAGLDVVRAPDGRFLVLEDNLRRRAASLAVAARELSLQLLSPAEPPQPLDELPACCRVAACRLAVESPRVAVLTDGPDNAAHWEHEWLARALDVPLVELDALDSRSVDVVYRRTNGDRLSDGTGRQARARLARGPDRPRHAFGIGVGDD